MNIACPKDVLRGTTVVTGCRTLNSYLIDRQLLRTQSETSSERPWKRAQEQDLMSNETYLNHKDVAE